MFLPVNTKKHKVLLFETLFCHLFLHWIRKNIFLFFRKYPKELRYFFMKFTKFTIFSILIFFKSKRFAGSTQFLHHKKNILFEKVKKKVFSIQKVQSAWKLQNLSVFLFFFTVFCGVKKWHFKWGGGPETLPNEKH